MRLKTRNQLRKINKTKKWFFEKISEVNKPLSRITRIKERQKKGRQEEMEEGRGTE